MPDLIIPPHLTLCLRHNEHKSSYQTVAEYCEQWDGDDWVSEDQRLKALATNELWEIQWCPDTPVGFCLRLAADLEALLEWAQPALPTPPSPQDDANTLKGLSGDDAEAAGKAEYFRVTRDSKGLLQWGHTASASESIPPNPKDPKGTK